MKIMPNKSLYFIEVKTSKDLGSEQFVRDLLEAWTCKLDERLRPERFGLNEPIRRSIAEEGIEAAITTWLTSDMSLSLKRQKKPKFQADIDWWKREKSLDTRLFPWTCSVRLDKAAKDNLAIVLFKFLIEHFEPAFGFLSTYDDYRDKHFATFEDRIGTVEQYVGLDVGDTLPGIYWVTYFGPWAVAKVGGTRLASLKAYQVQPLNGGYLVLACSSIQEVGSLPTIEAERLIANHLGKNHFFDKSLANISSTITDIETASGVEKAVDQYKKKRL